VLTTANKIAGVDEAGRGPLAGPVVAAAVIFTVTQETKGLKDSKALTAKQREAWFAVITNQSLAWGIGIATVAEIDRLNILQASFLAMSRALANLALSPDQVLIDGPHSPVLAWPTQAIVRGDQQVPVIAAASILAKVTRDHIMAYYDQQLPVYGFAKHKGYGTAQHLQALAQYGPSSVHRHSFTPVARIVNQFGY
jgi:ribonuclease HII